MSTHSVGRHMQGMPLLRWRSDGPGLGQCIGSQPDSRRLRARRTAGTMQPLIFYSSFLLEGNLSGSEVPVCLPVQALIGIEGTHDLFPELS